MRLKLDHQNVWFASDYHFHHANVIKFDGRPFDCVEDMNETLIENWNSVVKDNDIVFYLGDLSFNKNIGESKQLVNRLKGKIHFILGNHDDEKFIKELKRFESVSDYINLTIADKDHPQGKQSIMMMHYAMLRWDKAHYGSWHLHGHSHHSLMKDPNYDDYYKRRVLDMGCNGWDYTPVSYSEIKKIMITKEDTSHH
jgi:calcineurin-like phosphoesterase family protein